MRMRWLAAVAGVALIAGAPVTADARVKPHAVVKTHAAAKARKRKPARRVRAARTVVVPVPVPVVAPPAIVTPAPPVYGPAPSYPRAADPGPGYAAYRWLDDAAAMLNAIGESRPDLAFAVDGQGLYAWVLADGAVAIAEPLGRDDRRWYFFAPDVTVPFLVRDVDRSFAFERGGLAAAYDEDGGLSDPRGSDEARAAALFARGRRLWFAARDPAPPPPRLGGGWRWFGGDAGWRVNSDWRAYRDRFGHPDRDDRYARERRDRAARGDDARPAPRPERPPAPPRADRPTRDRPERDRATPPGVAAPADDAVRPTVPAGTIDGRERGASEPTPARPPRPAREAPPPTATPEPPRARPEPAMPAPAPAPPRAESRPEPQAARPAPAPEVEAPRAREPEPRAAPPPQPTPQPAPPPAPERPKEQQGADEKPQ